VTVLFADVKGSTELAAQVDPEEWHQILDRFFAILTAGVHRFDGTINQYTGDGVMALFGAPIACEDHAQQACYAALQLREGIRRYALELRRAKGLDFAVRMGLNSGEVIVGKIGDDLRMDYTAQGHTVNLAARMERLAAADMIYLTEETATLVRGYVQLADLGRFDVKGVPHPVRVSELQGRGGVRSRFEMSRARGFSRFVGRDAELRFLREACDRAVGGEGQVIGMVGQAGVGKSRLCDRFLQECRGLGMDVHSFHGVAHGRTIPYLPVLDLMRSYFDIQERDDDKQAREKVAGKLLLLDEAFRDDLGLLFDFLGVRDESQHSARLDPEVRQRRLFTALRRLLETSSRGVPSIFLLEDLQWIDGGTAAFIERLIEDVPATRTLVVVNFRPGFRAPWMAKPYYHRLRLGPLNTEATDELLVDLLGNDPSLRDLLALVHKRTRGNPFFVEEVVRSLKEGGQIEGDRGAFRLRELVTSLTIPATVRAVLSARIDRLEENDKAVLQTAAVIGRRFSRSVLARVVDVSEVALDASLAELADSGFLVPGEEAGNVDPSFHHPLIREVAYDSMLAARRRQIHTDVAASIIELFPDALDERSALLAHHWQEAGDVREAARWHRGAALWAGVSDSGEALRHWREVRSCAASLPPGAERSVLQVEACRGILNSGWRVGLSDELSEVFSEGRSLAEASGDLRSMAVLVNLYGNIRGMAGEPAAYLEHAAEAVQLAEKVADPGVLLVLSLDLAIAHFRMGHVRRALDLLDATADGDGEAFSRGTEVFGWSPRVYRIVLRGWFLVEAARLDEASSDLARGRELAQANGDSELTLMAVINQARLAFFVGDQESALERAREAVEIGEKVGNRAYLGWAWAVHGLVDLLRARWDDALRAFAQAAGCGWHSGEGRVLASHAEAHLGRGDLARAREVAHDAVAEARQIGSPLSECHAQIALARVLLRTAGTSAQSSIQAAIERAQEIVEESGARVYEPFVLLERAALARALRDEEAANRARDAACELFAGMGATGYVRRIRAG
jgi:class 3 adenylate cyclase/tetratricopeptide (TPR) repeat protein